MCISAIGQAEVEIGDGPSARGVRRCTRPPKRPSEFANAVSGKAKPASAGKCGKD